MKDLIDSLDEFDEESQKLLNSIITSGKVISFDNFTNSNLKSIMTGGPDYRSPFHDYRNTPLGYSYLTDHPVSVFPSTGVNEKGEKGYEYTAEVLPCDNGSQVLGSYNANKREPQSLFLFYEKPNPQKSNFAGDFYLVKMGDYFVQLFKRFPQPLSSKINGKHFKDITSMEDEAAYLTQMAYTYEGDEIDATLVYQALMMEYQFYTGDRRFEEIIGNISSIPANAIGWCAEQLEDFKPEEKNYNPEAKDYSPLVPILGTSLPVNMNRAAQFFENLGNNPFAQGAEVAFSKVWSIVEQAAGKIKNLSMGHLPDAFKKLVDKISSIISNIKSFFTDVEDIFTELAKQGLEFLKLSNAFYCGINSGIISLIQCILYILEFILQPSKVLSYEQYKQRRDLLEKAEDVLDWAVESVPVFLKGVKDLFKASGSISQSDLEEILDKMKEYWGDISRYTVAFYAGVFVFELLINILLLIFTEGAGNIIKGATYTKKAANLLRVLTRETFSVVTMGITDLLVFLGKFITKFAQVCKNGWRAFIKWIEDLFGKSKYGEKIDDALEDVKEIEEVIVNGRKKKNPKDFNEREILEYLKKYNFHGHYSLYDLKKIWLQSIVLKLSLKDLIDFIKTGSLLKIERRSLTDEMNFFTKQVKNKFALQTSKLIKGKNSLRNFDINNCGGEILNLDWQNIEIFEEGLDMIKKHLERLESDVWNDRMIKRLEKIIDKEIPETDFDKRFYTHEIREFRRYKNLGYENSNFKDIPDEIWDNAHASTLEDYKLYEKVEYNENNIYVLFHPDVQF